LKEIVKEKIEEEEHHGSLSSRLEQLGKKPEKGNRNQSGLSGKAKEPLNRWECCRIYPPYTDVPYTVA